MVVVIVSVLLVVCTFIIVRAPKRWLTIWRKYLLRTMVAMFVIVAFNMIGNGLGFHIPINLFTIGMISMLGISGLITVVSLQFFLL